MEKSFSTYFWGLHRDGGGSRTHDEWICTWSMPAHTFIHIIICAPASRLTQFPAELSSGVKEHSWEIQVLTEQGLTLPFCARLPAEVCFCPFVVRASDRFEFWRIRPSVKSKYKYVHKNNARLSFQKSWYRELFRIIVESLALCPSRSAQSPIAIAALAFSYHCPWYAIQWGEEEEGRWGRRHISTTTNHPLGGSRGGGERKREAVT